MVYIKIFNLMSIDELAYYIILRESYILKGIYTNLKGDEEKLLVLSVR